MTSSAKFTLSRALFVGVIVATLWRVLAHDPWQEAKNAWQQGKFDVAVRIWGKMAAEGDVNAQVMLAHAYAEGSGVEQDNPKAISMYRDAAQRGSGEGQYLLAEAYLRGNGVEQDLNKAYQWMELAASSGQVVAQLKLGLLCLLGVKGMPEWEKGKRWLVRAASAGNDTALWVLRQVQLREAGESRFPEGELDTLLGTQGQSWRVKV